MQKKKKFPNVQITDEMENHYDFTAIRIYF